MRTRDKASVEKRIRDAINSADPNLPLASLSPLTQIARNSLARPRFYASMASAFGAFAVVLAAIGIYGLLGYRTSLRTGEIAVRMALGSRRAQVIAMVVRQGVRLVAAGVFLGLIGAYYVRQLLRAMPYAMPYNRSGVGAILFATALLAAVAALASFLTAFQAASIEPMIVLRNE